MKRWTPILFFLFTGQSLSSQLVFEHISSVYGLSSDKVNDIIQDREGFYWIATSEGLNRFDGSTFKVYRHDKNDSTTLSHNTCNALLEDDNGDIWVATMQGISRFIRKKGKFRRYYFSRQGFNNNMLNTVMSLTKDGEGNIWAAAIGLWKLNLADESKTGFMFRENQINAISDPSQCHQVFFDKKRNGVWLTTSLQLNFFDLASQKFHHHKNNPLNWPVFTWENKRPFISVDTTGQAWMYDEQIKKLYYTDPKSGNFSSRPLSFPKQLSGFFYDGQDNLVFSMELMNAMHYNIETWKNDTLNYAPEKNIQRINYKLNRYYTDKEKNIWLCTLSGLHVARNIDRKYRVLYAGDESNGLPRSINGMILRKDEIYFGIKNKLYKNHISNRNIMPVYDYPSPHDLIPVFNAGDSMLWISNDNNFLLMDFIKMKLVKQVNIGSSISSIFTGNQKEFWISTWSNGVFVTDEQGNLLKHYTTGNGLKNNYIVSSFIDGNKSIWFGYNGGQGFSRFDFKTEKFEHFLIHSDNGKTGEINTITAILSEETGNIWLGTYGSGIYYYDSKKNNYQNFRVQDGLSGDYINTLAKDVKGNLWVTTSNGIDILNTRSKTFYHINENMKFGSNDHMNNFTKSGNNSFYYFSINKILSIQPGDFVEDFGSPAILVSSFKVFDEEYPLASTLSFVKLPYSKNFFSVEYSVLKPSPVIPAIYKYKLDGFDKDWNNAGNRGMANYTNLPPGKYRLLLNATDEAGRWKNQPLSIDITITPPYWRTAWFISLSILVVLSGLYLFYRYRIAQVKKMYSLRSKISQDLHDEVASTLSGIRLYSEMAKQQLQNQNAEGTQHSLNIISSNANEMAQDMSDIVWAINPANDSLKKLLQKLKAYTLELTQAAGIEFHYSILDQIPEEKLNMEQRRNIYLVCKEAINNAVKYSDAKNIDLNVERTDHTVKIKIADNGKGFDPASKNNGNGLMNMKLRAKEIGAVLLLNSQIGNGTSVELNIKLQQ